MKMSTSWLCCLTAVLLLVMINSSAAADTAYREEPVKVIIQVDGLQQGNIDMALTLRSGDAFRLDLIAASGSGYVWQMADSATLLRVHKSEPKPLVDSPKMSGGPFLDSYTLQAGNKPGTETIRFLLIRPWEDSKTPVKTLTVTLTVQP